MSQAKYDIAIVGLGAVGSAALYQAAKKGLKTIGFDTYQPPHAFGSSHGESRIVRQAIGENSSYSKISLRSYQIWEDLEKSTDQSIIHRIGSLIMMPAREDSSFFNNTLKAAEQFNIAHQLLDAEEISSMYPEFSAFQDIKGFYEPNGGYVIPEFVVALQIKAAQNMQALVHNQTRISQIIPQDNCVTLVTDDGNLFKAAKVIIAAGPWSTQFLPDSLKDYFKVTRQVLYWFDLKNAVYFKPQNTPVFIIQYKNHKGIYGFPAIHGPSIGIKLAKMNYDEYIVQDELKRMVSEQEIESFYEDYLKNHFNQVLTPRCLKTAVCSYTKTPDEEFIVDYLHDSKQVLFVSACSGHGFKHSAGMGELIINMLSEEKTIVDPNMFVFK